MAFQEKEKTRTFYAVSRACLEPDTLTVMDIASGAYLRAFHHNPHQGKAIALAVCTARFPQFRKLYAEYGVSATNTVMDLTSPTNRIRFLRTSGDYTDRYMRSIICSLAHYLRKRNGLDMVAIRSSGGKDVTLYRLRRLSVEESRWHAEFEKRSSRLKSDDERKSAAFDMATAKLGSAASSLMRIELARILLNPLVTDDYQLTDGLDI